MPPGEQNTTLCFLMFTFCFFLECAFLYKSGPIEILCFVFVCFVLFFTNKPLIVTKGREKWAVKAGCLRAAFEHYHNCEYEHQGEAGGWAAKAVLRTVFIRDPECIVHSHKHT